MTDPRIQGPSRLPSAPAEYDPEFMNRLIGLIDQYSSQVNARHKILGTTMNLSMLPTTDTGLRYGDVWNYGGFLVIVSDEDPIPGVPGPPGPEGPEGPAGEQGPQGDPGTDGRTVLYGTVGPTTEGADGDFYIDTTTNYLYGPKTAGVWPAGISLVGPQGEQGVPGTPADDCAIIQENC